MQLILPQLLLAVLSVERILSYLFLDPSVLRSFSRLSLDERRKLRRVRGRLCVGGSSLGSAFSCGSALVDDVLCFIVHARRRRRLVTLGACGICSSRRSASAIAPARTHAESATCADTGPHLVSSGRGAALCSCGGLERPPGGVRSSA